MTRISSCPESIMRAARLIADRWADDENTEECAEDIAKLVMAERERCHKLVSTIGEVIATLATDSKAEGAAKLLRLIADDIIQPDQP